MYLNLVDKKAAWGPPNPIGFPKDYPVPKTISISETFIGN